MKKLHEAALGKIVVKLLIRVKEESEEILITRDLAVNCCRGVCHLIECSNRKEDEEAEEPFSSMLVLEERLDNSLHKILFVLKNVWRPRAACRDIIVRSIVYFYSMLDPGSTAQPKLSTLVSLV